MAAQAELGEDLPRVPAGKATIADRIAAFAMLDGMSADTTQAKKCLRLALIGFSVGEIAAMLQTSSATVSQNLYAERRKATPAKKAAKKASKNA